MAVDDSLPVRFLINYVCNLHENRPYLRVSSPYDINPIIAVIAGLFLSNHFDSSAPRDFNQSQRVFRANNNDLPPYTNSFDLHQAKHPKSCKCVYLRIFILQKTRWRPHARVHSSFKSASHGRRVYGQISVRSCSLNSERTISTRFTNMLVSSVFTVHKYL